jgi:glycosyltransferase involved in cell wall biosynthesis
MLGPVGRIARLRHILLDAPRIAQQWGADLYFSVAELVPPWLPCPSVASFRNPNVVDRKRHHWYLRQKVRLGTLHSVARLSGRLARRILFVSHDSARWMGDDLRIPEDKRVVIHHGIDLDAWRKPAERVFHDRPYILSVSSVYRYKNYVRLIEAWAELARRVPDAPDLLIIGDDQDAPYSLLMEQAHAATGDLAERIHILGAIPYARVRGYYAGAEMFVFPSYLETFGHPLLEAMACRLPLVAADIPVFREIAGDAALYADPYDSTAIADAMQRALDPVVRRGLLERGEACVRHFSWGRSAETHLALFRSLC